MPRQFGFLDQLFGDAIDLAVQTGKVVVADFGAAPAELEAQVTKPIEDAVSGVEGVHNILSTITDGVSGPSGSFVDKHGNLYVANDGNFTVTMYPKGSTSWKLRYTGFAYPLNVAVDSKGSVFIVDFTGEKVVEFPKGSTRSKLTIPIGYPAHGVALDSNDNVYVSYNTGAHGGGRQVDDDGCGSEVRSQGGHVCANTALDRWRCPRSRLGTGALRAGAESCQWCSLY